MDNERTVFYDRNDMCYGMGLSKIESLTLPELGSIGINDAIEFFEIKRYFDDNVQCKEWTEEQRSGYQEKSKKLFGIAMRFVNGLSDANIVSEYEMIENHPYRKSFWRLFVMCRLFEKISEEVFKNLLHTNHVSLYDILVHEKISQQYGKVIRDFILSTPEYIHLILRVYEQNYTKTEKLYLPTELTQQDIAVYISSYIDSDNPNLNYLESIVQMRDLDGKIRVKAKRKHDEKSRKLLEQGPHMEYGIGVRFSPEQDEEKTASGSGMNPNYSYSTKWLLETLDYPSILNNFIYLFEYADVPQMRCLHVSKESQAGVLERAIRSKSTRHYPDYFAFKMKNHLASIQMTAYYDFLKENEIRYETVLEWFFTQCIQEEYSCPEMRVALPSEGASFFDKCNSICSAFETILKQYTLFVENGEIDFDLLEMTADSKKFGDIPSQVQDKYIYGTGKEFASMRFMLFSDQCMFSYVKRIYDEGREHSCFYDLITKEKVYLSDYRENEQPSFKWLEKKDLVSISDDGLITIGNPRKVNIVKDLFDNDVISRWHYPAETQPIFQEWIDEGYLEAKSSLLSQPEVDYFNYVLNNAEYVNGLELRNRYTHGNQQSITDERIHESNYNFFLRLLTILAIKINDDFILKDYLDKARSV